MKISVVIPCYNEIRTIKTLQNRVQMADVSPYTKEIIIIDDGSTDGTREYLQTLQTNESLKIIYNRKNEGKGASLRAGFRIVTGDLIIIQDADLEYNPEEYVVLLEPFQDSNVEVVYGSRYKNNSHRPFGTWFITWITNMLYGAQLSDETTCYKVFRTSLLRDIELCSKGFEFCAEITAKILKKDIAIHEVPIHYHRRTKKEGKKLHWLRDGLSSAWTLIRYRFH